MSKLYLGGKITGDEHYREKFYRAAAKLEDQGHAVMNPATLPDGFDYEEYMAVCFTMIDQCEVVALLPDFEDSPGALREKAYAEKTGREVMILDDSFKLCTCLACEIRRAMQGDKEKPKT